MTGLLQRRHSLERRVAASKAKRRTSGRPSSGHGVLYARWPGQATWRLTLRHTKWANGLNAMSSHANETTHPSHSTPWSTPPPGGARSSPGHTLSSVRRDCAQPPRGLFSADRSGLDLGAGVDVHTVLLAHGASAGGDPGGTLRRRHGPARFRVGARFPDRDSLLPLVAYVLTRVCPVAAGMPARSQPLGRSPAAFSIASGSAVTLYARFRRRLPTSPGCAGSTISRCSPPPT